MKGKKYLFIAVLALLLSLVFATSAFAADTDLADTGPALTADDSPILEDGDNSEGLLPADGADIEADADNNDSSDTAEDGDDSEGTLPADGDKSTNYEVHFGEDQQVTIQGGGATPLADILASLGIEGEVTAATGSNDALFTLSQDENGVWQFNSHNAFSTEQTMTLVINGEEVVVRVTDGNVKSVIGNSETEHDTVKAAIAAAGEASEIKISLKGNVDEGEEDIIVASGKTVIIDLCGYTLSGYLNVETGGSLTISNTVALGAADNGRVSKEVWNAGSLTIQGGVFSDKIWSTGTLLIRGGTFDSNIMYTSGDITITGGAFAGLVPEDGKPNNTVTFAATDSANKTWTAYGSGGLDALLTMAKNSTVSRITVMANKLGYWDTLVVNRTNMEAAANADIFTFKDGVDSFYVNARRLSGSEGGAYYAPVSDREGYDNNGATYDNIGRAWDKADVVYLAKDISRSNSKFDFGTGKLLTIDLNGYSINCTADHSSVVTNRDLTILDSYGGGKINSTTLYTASGATMTIYGGTVKGIVTNYRDEAIIIYGGTFQSNVTNNIGGTLIIHGGTFTREVSNQAGGVMTVDGGTIALILNAGALDINGGTVAAISNAGTVNVNAGTVTTLSMDVARSTYTKTGGSIDTVVFWKDYNGTIANDQMVKLGHDCAPVFLGNRVLADKTKAVRFDSLPYAVLGSVAEDEGFPRRKYVSVEAAAAQYNFYVELLGNVTEINVAADQGFRLNLNNHTVTRLNIAAGGNVRIKNGTIGEINSLGSVVLDGDVTVTTLNVNGGDGAAYQSTVGTLNNRCDADESFEVHGGSIGTVNNYSGIEFQCYQTSGGEYQSYRVTTLNNFSGGTAKLLGGTFTAVNNAGACEIGGNHRQSVSITDFCHQTGDAGLEIFDSTYDGVYYPADYSIDTMHLLADLSFADIRDEQLLRNDSETAVLHVNNRILAKYADAVRYDSLPYAVGNSGINARYFVLEGRDQHWTKGGEALRFLLNAQGVLKVMIDGEEVEFTVNEKGEIEIAVEILEALEFGEHEITFVFADGSCATTFTIE